MGGSPPHCRVFSRTPGLYPLEANSISCLPTHHSNKSYNNQKYPLETKLPSQLRATGLYKCPPLLFGHYMCLANGGTRRRAPGRRKVRSGHLSPRYLLLAQSGWTGGVRPKVTAPVRLPSLNSPCLSMCFFLSLSPPLSPIGSYNLSPIPASLGLEVVMVPTLTILK